MSTGNKQFGERIKELRERKGLTQEKLAEYVNLEYQTISRIETGENFTSFVTLGKLAENLGVEIKDLFDYNHIQSEDNLRGKITAELDNADIEELKFFYSILINYPGRKK